MAPYYSGNLISTLRQNVTVIPGKAYDASIWAKISGTYYYNCLIWAWYNTLLGAVGVINPSTGAEYTQTVRRVSTEMTASGFGTLMFYPNATAL